MRRAKIKQIACCTVRTDRNDDPVQLILALTEDGTLYERYFGETGTWMEVDGIFEEVLNND